MKNVIVKVLERRFLLKYVVVIALIAGCGVAYRISGQGVFNKYDREGYAVGVSQADGAQTLTGEVYEDGESETESKAGVCYAYVCGYVVSPGVYQCETGSRVYELIQKAGGFCEEADRDYLNLVSVVFDGQKIYVPKQGETGLEQEEYAGQTVKININTAAKRQLMELPGIGETRAEQIISYRSANGAFQSIEDIMKVSGIKNAAYEKIKDLICV